jgi:hypothetical protein
MTNELVGRPGPRVCHWQPLSHGAPWVTGPSPVTMFLHVYRQDDQRDGIARGKGST